MEFKGIKAQYIIYLAIGLVALLLLFAILFIAGLNTYLCLCIVLPSGEAAIKYKTTDENAMNYALKIESGEQYWDNSALQQLKIAQHPLYRFS